MKMSILINFDINAGIEGSLNIFYCQILYSNGVGSQVLTTLVTTLPLQVIHTLKLINMAKHVQIHMNTYTTTYEY